MAANVLDAKNLAKSFGAIARMVLVRSFQISAVFNSMTARENVMLA
ncbi:hypothetical protein [uncultured Roseovarius sp.]|nr:hypothetical protein [uncultured Roseovarius sp.]